MSDRLACRLAYAAMVLALAAACTPDETEIASAPAPVQPDIVAAAPDAGPAARNLPDTLTSLTDAEPAAPPAPEAAPPASQSAAEAAAESETKAPSGPAESPAEPAPAAPAAAPDLALGAAAWARTCTMCHGPTGKGTQMAKGVVTKSVEVVKNKVVKGAINPGDKMPPMSAGLSADELEAIAHFVAAGFPAQ